MRPFEEPRSHDATPDTLSRQGPPQYFRTYRRFEFPANASGRLVCPLHPPWRTRISAPNAHNLNLDAEEGDGVGVFI
jgi:hypothetical protein